MSEPPPSFPGYSPSGEPEYPQQPYAPYGHQPTVRGGLNLGRRAGVRALRRPEARFGVSLAAGGAVLVIVGVLVWGIGYFATGLHFDINSDSQGFVSTQGQSRRFLGAGLSLVLVVLGYVLVVVRRRGPLATAGVVASGLGVPIMLIFVSLDLQDLLLGQPPFSLDVVSILSIIAWLVSYLAVPGTQGRAFYLAAAAIGLATYAGLKTGEHALVRSVGSVTAGGFRGSGAGSFAAIGLVFGLAYYALAAVLDRNGRSGAAVGLVVAAFDVTVGGVVAAVPTFHQVGTGVLLIVVGGVLGWYGGHFGRRFTTWVWTAGVVIGVGLVVEKVLPRSTTGAGVVLVLVGAVVVVAAQVLSDIGREAPDIEDVPTQVPAAPR
jgi:hypothetical protein